MAVVSVADQYMVMMAITLLFTILGLAYTRKTVLSLLAGLSWFISGLANLAIGDPTSPLTISLSWLFLGIGFIFIVKTVQGVLKTMSEKRWSTEL